MVEGLQEIKPDQTGATFVDLDGTLLKGNSMRVLMRRIPWTLLGKWKIGASIAAFWWIALRSVRVIDHKKMKWRLTRLARRHYSDADWMRVAKVLSHRVNPLVKGYIEAPRLAQCRVYIATAAMEEYVAPLCRLLGYDGVIATRFSEDYADYEEMRGAAKRDGIRAMMKKEGLRMESFLTDHYDDFPTASAFPGLTILVSPSKKMIKIFRHAGVSRCL